MKNKSPLAVRIALGLLLFVTISVVSVGYFYGYKILKVKSEKVNQYYVEAKTGEDNLTQMQLLEKKLKEYKDIQDIQDKIFMPSKSYQEQAIKLINQYASTSGVSVNQINFDQKNKNSEYANVIISLSNPLDYNNLIKFISLLEKSLTQIQISQINIQKVDKSNSINVGPILINIYTK